MSTWGLAVLSLGLLMTAYHNWFGLIFVILGVVMLIVSRVRRKKADKANKEAVETHKNKEIKSRK